VIELITWISAIILGPGALAIFVWFLIDLRSALSPEGERVPWSEAKPKATDPRDE
jgi:hypothetical protein